MKTTNAFVIALVAMCVSVSAFAYEPVNSKMAVLNAKAGVFKVIYAGAKPGKVSMRIIDQNGTELYSETIKSNRGFVMPVNFNGMAYGLYIIEITDESGTLSQTADYRNEVAQRSAYITKLSEAGKYLLAVPNKGVDEITVKIYDASQKLIHEEKLAITNNFGVVFNLTRLEGEPSFVITDKAGNTLVTE